MKHCTLSMGTKTGDFRPWALACALLAAAACGGPDAQSSAQPTTSDTRVSSLPSDVPLDVVEAPPRSTRAPAGRPTAPEPGQAIDVTAMGYAFGSDSAPVRVVEFSDFGCGYCRQFHTETFPVLHEEFVATGKIAWRYVPFVIGMFANGEEAAAAGECAGEQGKFVEMRQRLFEDQRTWKGASEPEDVFLRFAREEGLDVDRFATCVAEGWRDDAIATSTRTAMQLGVRGTPTFFVDGYPITGALPLELFRDLFRVVLKEAEAGGR